MQDSVIFHVFTAVRTHLLLITALPHLTPTHIPLLALGSGKLPLWLACSGHFTETESHSMWPLGMGFSYLTLVFKVHT